MLCSGRHDGGCPQQTTPALPDRTCAQDTQHRAETISLQLGAKKGPGGRRILERLREMRVRGGHQGRESEMAPRRDLLERTT